MEKDLRIVYMGTPDFAVPTLDKLVNEGYNVVGVVTMPDKAIGRHHEVLQASPVKQYALTHNIPVLQPEKLRDENFLQELEALKADLQIVVAFRMLPKVVWAMPRLGTFNLHAALLPQYRGAAPINWAIINGETETGITTFYLDHEIDTGRILLQERVPILETDCVEDIHDKLMERGACLVKETVDLIARGEAKAIPQEHFMTDEPLHHAPKIFRETCEIKWKELHTKQAYDFIRGLSPYPAAWSTMVYANGQQQVLKIYKAAYKKKTHHEECGSINTDGKTYMDVYVSDGILKLIEVQLSGKKKMNIEDFLRGAHLQDEKPFLK